MAERDTLDLPTLIEQAREADQARRWPEALARWQAVRARNPDHMWAHVRLGMIQGELGNPEEAEAILQAAALRWPDHIAPLQGLAQLATQGKRWGEALARWQEVAARDPEHPTALRHVGNLLVEMEVYDEAERVLSAVVESGLAEDPMLRMRLAQAAAAQGHFALVGAQIEAILSSRGYAVLERVGFQTQVGYGLIVCGAHDRALRHFRSLGGFEGKGVGVRQGHETPVSGVRRGQPRALVLDHNLRKITGHHYNTNLFYKRFFEGRGFCVDFVCGHPVFDARIVAEIAAIPYFSLQSFVGGAWLSTFEALLEFNAFFKAELDDLTPYCQADVIVFHSVRLTIIHGLACWLKQHFEGGKLLVVVAIIGSDYIDPAHAHHALAQRLYRLAFDLLGQIEGLELILFGETRPVTQFLQSVSDHIKQVSLVPYLAADIASEYVGSPAPAGSPLRIGYLGMTRKERGAHLVPALILAAQDRLERPVEWLVQLDPEALRTLGGTAMTAQLEALERLDSVHRYAAGLSLSRYYTLFAQVDILLLPYDVRYQVSGSGVFFEAMALGKVQVVPRGSSMAEVMVACGGEPVVFEALTVEGMLEALRYATEQYEELAARAGGARERWLDRYSGRVEFERVFREKAGRIGLDLTP